MGCSPSKGKLFSKPEAPGLRSDVPPEAPLDRADCGPEEDKCLNAEEKGNEALQRAEELHTKETEHYHIASNATAIQNQEDIKETEENALPQDTVSDSVPAARPAKMEKRKKTKGKRKSTEKRRKSSIVHAKVDFPPHMVRAHHAAYTFLNPNISKYETLLGLLDQAAQTQLSLQPMMSALVMRFEEINQALEEMAEEGELMLKEHGDYMALPSGMLGPALMSAKPSSTDAVNPPDPPPDLLQQLLQHSTEKMRQVGTSVQAVGDTTLEEAADYFSSLSKLLAEKMRAKQTAERRLAQVLARVEGAALRKSNPEDSALHSEDSGIGGENESLTGSERHRRHRGSAGSGSCGSGVNIRGTSDNPVPNLPNLEDQNEDDEEDEEEEEEDDDEEDDDEESETPRRKRSNSSPPDPSQALSYMRASYIRDQHLKRPLGTGASPEQSLSTRCVNMLLDLQKNHTDLDPRVKNMADIQENKETPASQYNLYRAGIRRHSLNVSASGNKGLFRSIQAPCSLPKLVPKPPKRNSVRRLINTFSQGVDGRPGQSLANVPPLIRKPKKSDSLHSSDRTEGGFIINGNNNNNSWPDSRDDMDADNLPPPPPEVLMDNSFQRTDGLSRNDEGSQENSARSLPMINQKTGLSQRLKASIQNVEVLPNRASARPRSVAVSSTRPVRQDAVMGAQEAEQQSLPDLDPEIEKANCLYQQARKIIHLRDSVESSDKRKVVNSNMEFYEGDVAACSPTVTAPPVSRVRLPPSCPSVSHRFPSPPAFRPQTASKTSSRPSSPRAVTRASDKTPEEIVPSVSFRDARSVFCRNESETPKAPGSCVLPRRFGEASRGRLSARETDSPTRRTRSEQRPGGAAQAEFSRDGRVALNRGARENEPAVTNYSPLLTGEDGQ